MPGIFHIVLRSIVFYKKPVLYQLLIIILLAAVITGSLLTGSSVKESLKKSASEHLGNTDILISSGTRYFSPELVQRMKGSSGFDCTGLLELNGYSQNLITQKGAFNSHIFGVSNDFFTFQGNKSESIRPGEIAVNKRLADWLGIGPGDELIIRFPEITDIPSDAPFAPGKDAGKSVVMKVGTILESAQNGNFSLSISQISPMNIFINLPDIEDKYKSQLKINRILVRSNNSNSLNVVYQALKQHLKPEDIGINCRMVKATGEYELVSDRVFIDDAILKEISKLVPSSAPVITYLGNRFDKDLRSTPYSFISGLPSSLYPEIGTVNEMIINRWLANDLSANIGDKVKVYWYSVDSVNKLIERNSDFIIKQIVDMKGKWSDSLLMPGFPGISEKESCSDWDAGVPIKMNKIRSKDEDYWNKYRGTPKAFISYEKGIELWGNNFGSATAIRYPAGITAKEIENKLEGSLDPANTGFSITDLYGESVKAANEGVDFGALFLSLGFFLILASLILLSFTVSSYFNSKRSHINTLFALGFQNMWITRLLFLEALIIVLTGCSIGAFAGYLVNIVITRALNTVWIGAVQTDALHAYFDYAPILSGFVLTFVAIMMFILIKVKRYLKGLSKMKKEKFTAPPNLKNLYLFLISAIVTVTLFILSLLFRGQELTFSFIAGTTLLLTLVLLWKQYYIGRFFNISGRIKKKNQLSHIYYSFYPSNALTPILFIAAGIFTVFITSTNQMNFNEKQLKRSGGTGGYLLWCENTIPVSEDLNTESGRKTMGLDDDQYSDMSFVQMKRSSGNEASCLNLNHITAPPLLGIDPADLIAKRSFSFSKVISDKPTENPWQYLLLPSENNTIYGIADQTVLDWGLKLKPGDTLVLRAESGQPLNIIIAAGLKSSVFQGNVLIGKENFTKYYPSVSGNQVFLIDGKRALTEAYRTILNERLENFGVIIEKTTDRLISFYRVTNTYLSVFGVFGALGMIIGVAGMGFVLLRNYNERKHEFALMLATGFSVKDIKKMILSEQMLILFAGVTSGIVAALVATIPSIRNNAEIPWLFILLTIVIILITGLFVQSISVRSVTKNSLVKSLKKE